MSLALVLATDDDGAVTIDCAGELDVSTAAKLIDAFDRVYEQRPRQIAVDLRGVTFLDSTGLGCLMHGALCCKKLGIELEVVPSEATRYVMYKAGLANALPERQP